MNNLLEVDNLTIEFKTDSGYFPAVKDVSFTVKQGEIIGLVGESGSGKSVTTLALMGLLPPKNSRISRGSIRFQDVKLLDQSSQFLRKLRGKEISMVFQEPMSALNPVYTIGNQMREIFINHSAIPRKDMTDRVIRLIDQVGIPRPADIIRNYPHELSGGMRQRIIIAMAIALKPKLLIADEPTTALDVTIQAQIIELLQRLSVEHGISIIFITHNLSLAAEICRRIVVMYAGELVEIADTEQFYRSPKHPYAIGLLDCIPRIGSNTRELSFIPGTVPPIGETAKGCCFSSRCRQRMDICDKRKPPFFRLPSDHFSKCWLYEQERR